MAEVLPLCKTEAGCPVAQLHKREYGNDLDCVDASAAIPDELLQKQCPFEVLDDFLLPGAIERGEADA